MKGSFVRGLSSLTSAKLVFVSRSHNVFANLALEEWFYRNWDFSKLNMLLFWRNEPCVVIGRHQNPWAEANLCRLREGGVELARRNSGGGTVYHDLGNLNCTFFTAREKYNRKKNLEFVCKALREEWGLDVLVSPREDVMLDGTHKISGTASKLGNKSSYHHCTLLINVDSSALHDSLRAPALQMESKATASVRSPVINLSSVCPSMTVDRTVEVIGASYLDRATASLSSSSAFISIDPTEEQYPGITKMRDEFNSWHWVYGKTPRFSIQLPLAFDQFLELDIYRGVIEKINYIGVDDDSVSKSWASLLLNHELNDGLRQRVLHSRAFESTIVSGTAPQLERLLSHLCPTAL